MSVLLEVKGLKKCFGKKIVLDDLNFKINRGEILGLLGKNGAGKTTLMKILLGLIREYSGEIYYEGNILNHSNVKIMNTIGSLVDAAFYNELTAYENMKILMMVTPTIKKNEYNERIIELLKFVDLDKYSKRPVKAFSFGMKQRLALAQALISDPKLLILDEPFVGLDPIGIEIVKDTLIKFSKEKEVSIIFSSHQLTEVEEISQNLLVIDSGKIRFFGSYDDAMKTDKKIFRVTVDNTKICEMNLFDKNLVKISNNIIEFESKDDYLPYIFKILSEKNIKVIDIDVENKSLIKFFKD
ncbi:MAG: ABC transporter ATP-binding protein [Clostridiales bacterium]|nr:ABC transporter ATP-binding protein [Clostridiales bacterium]HPT76418.1 ABC transporter ATP-binding protein [Defluviitaleaceae bacterium]